MRPLREVLDLARVVQALLEKHQNQVYRDGLRRCGNEADARDVLRETSLARQPEVHLRGHLRS